MGIASLELLNVRKTFGDTTVALDDFSLNVSGGEFITLLGPSGCGKTTALNCLAGLVPPTSGEIKLDGKRIDALPPERRGFGMVFQNYALFPHLTVEKNVAFGLELRGLPKSDIRTRVERALSLVQLEPARFSSRYPRQLSGGQQQRLALARAMVLEPRLLLLDEPLSNLDAKLRADMRLELKRLHRQLGLTSVYVTHDQAEALSLSDRVVVMRDGRIEQIGTPEELYRHPTSLFVADFLGFKNRFQVDVEEADDSGLMVGAPGLRLAARSGARPPVGTQAVACFRPEDVRLAPNGSAGFEATVEIVEFLGQEYEAEAVITSQADSPSRVLLRSDQPLEAGSRLRLHVAPERVAVFPPDASG
jgi:putative spermidine/putrescine transport system ATP-binding protein